MDTKVTKYCSEDLQKVTGLIKEVTRSKEDIIQEVSNYLQERPGKQIRPTILILSSKLFEYEGTAHIKLGAAVELMHTATLLHDDIIDKAGVRRGRPSVNAKWGTEIALLVADYYFATAFNLVVESGLPNLAALLCQVALKMCEGEAYQQQLKDRFLSRPDYFKIIKHKTAYLFSACAHFGAAIARAEPAMIEIISDFGLNLGMAFQIMDDMLDFVATDTKWGKPVGNDIKQGKQTLPFIFALEASTPNHQKELRGFFNDGRNIHKIVNIIKKYDGFDYTRRTAQFFSARAKESLEAFDNTPIKEALIATADYITSRNF